MYKIDGVLIWKLQFCRLSNQVLRFVSDVIQTCLKIQLEILIRFSLDIRLRFIWYLGQIASGPKVLRNSLVIKWRGWINLGSLFSTPGLAQWFWCWGGENWEILWGLWERRGIGVVAGETLSVEKFSMVLAAWLITWCTRQLWPGLIPTIGKHTLVVLTTQWRPDTTSTTVTSIHRVRRIRGPHSVHMSDHWKGTTSPTTSHGGLWKELHPSTPSPKFAGSVSVKRPISSSTQRIVL